MTNALIVIEPGLDPAPSVALARGVAETVSVLVLAAPGESAPVESSADVTWVFASAGLEVAENAAAAIAEQARHEDASLVVLATTTRFREILPLAAAALGASSVADVQALSRVDGELRADRLLYGGVAVATVALARDTAVVSAPAPKGEGGSGAPVVQLTVAAPAVKERAARQVVTREVSLPTATKLVSFGRGVKNREDIALIERLAELLSAEVGCSRPIVEDMRWLTVDHQVGLTGTTVTPELYLAVGISGQIQHLVGMRDSKVIVAINANPAAPIFTVADVGVVGDLYEVVPRLIDALAARG